MAQQIRAAQQKAALSGQAPLAWAIGARCQAVWSGDGGWYNGTVSGVSVNSRFIVTFDDDGGVEEVRRFDSSNAQHRMICIDLYRRVQRTDSGGYLCNGRPGAGSSR